MIFSTFSCICGPFVCLIWRTFSSSQFRFLIGSFVVSLLSYVSSLYICISTPYQIHGCRYVLPFHRLPFLFVDAFLCCSDHSSSMKTQLLMFFSFAAFAFGFKSPKIIAKADVNNLIPCFLLGILQFPVFYSSLIHWE